MGHLHLELNGEVLLFFFKVILCLSFLMALPSLILAHNHYRKRKRMLPFLLHWLGTVVSASMLFLGFLLLLSFNANFLFELHRELIWVFPPLLIGVGIGMIYIACLCWIIFDALLRGWFRPEWELVEEAVEKIET